MQSPRRIFLPILLVFLIFNGLFIVSGGLLNKWGLDKDILIIANLLFLLLGIGAFMIQRKALQKSNPNVFIRSVMAVMMLKMLVCTIAVILYALLMRSTFSKMTVFVALFLYLVYLAVEVKMILKLNKQKNV